MRRHHLSSVFILFLLHYAKPTFYAAESGRQQLQYDNEDEQMADLVHQLALANRLTERQVPSLYEQVNESPEYVNSDLANNDYQQEQQEEQPELQQPQSVTTKPVIGKTKKGQSEFVEFVEPKEAQQQHSKQYLDKRVPAALTRVQHSGLKSISTYGNVLFVGMVSVCLVGIAAGMSGGGYYFYRMHMQQKAAENLDFTHYAPTGPGKNKKKKGGDEGLAYKAQLHHYQQAKQKIISGDDDIVKLPEQDDASEASDDDMNNFSVYECPGLAPTGDIEVQNPNFYNHQPSK